MLFEQCSEREIFIDLLENEKNETGGEDFSEKNFPRKGTSHKDVYLTHGRANCVRSRETTGLPYEQKNCSAENKQ